MPGSIELNSIVYVSDNFISFPSISCNKKVFTVVFPPPFKSSELWIIQKEREREIVEFTSLICREFTDFSLTQFKLFHIECKKDITEWQHLLISIYLFSSALIWHLIRKYHIKKNKFDIIFQENILKLVLVCKLTVKLLSFLRLLLMKREKNGKHFLLKKHHH